MELLCIRRAPNHTISPSSSRLSSLHMELILFRVALSIARLVDVDLKVVFHVFGYFFSPNVVQSGLKDILYEKTLNIWSERVGDDLNDRIPIWYEPLTEEPSGKRWPDLKWVRTSEEQVISLLQMMSTQDTNRINSCIPKCYTIPIVKRLWMANQTMKIYFGIAYLNQIPPHQLTLCFSSWIWCHVSFELNIFLYFPVLDPHRCTSASTWMRQCVNTSSQFSSILLCPWDH